MILFTKMSRKCKQTKPYDRNTSVDIWEWGLGVEVRHNVGVTNIYYFNCGDGFLDVHICQNALNYLL